MNPHLLYRCSVRAPWLCWLCFALLLTRVQAQPTVPPRVDPAAERAIEKGLRYLARTQNGDGSWSSDAEWVGMKAREITMTSFAVLAFMAGGNTAYEGPYSDHVRRGLEFLSRNAGKGGYIAADGDYVDMYGHGYALLALAQGYGSEKRPEDAEKAHRLLENAAKAVGKAQKSNGGWFYTPGKKSMRGEGSVTITQVQGLRATKDAGVSVSKTTVDKAVRYLEKTRKGSGGLKYDAQKVSRGPLLPITAAGYASMMSAGEYRSPLTEHCLRYVEKETAKGTNLSAITEDNNYAFYTWFYLAQSMYFSGGENWGNFYPRASELLVSTQTPEGTWQDRTGKVLPTAVGVMLLQMPYNYLPILQI